MAVEGTRQRPSHVTERRALNIYVMRFALLDLIDSEVLP